MDTSPTPSSTAWAAAAAAGGGGGGGLADLLATAATEVPPAPPDAAASVSLTWGSSSHMVCGSPHAAQDQPTGCSLGMPYGTAAATSIDDAPGVPLRLPRGSQANASSFLSPERVAAAVRIVAAAECRRHQLTGGYCDVDDGDSNDDDAGVKRWGGGGGGGGGGSGGGGGCGEGGLGWENPLDCMAAAAEVMSQAAAASTEGESTCGEASGGGPTGVDSPGSEVSESMSHWRQQTGSGGGASS